MSIQKLQQFPWSTLKSKLILYPWDKNFLTHLKIILVLSIEMISNSRCLDTMGYKVVLFLQSSEVTVGSLAFKENIARWYVQTKISFGVKLTSHLCFPSISNSRSNEFELLLEIKGWNYFWLTYNTTKEIISNHCAKWAAFVRGMLIGILDVFLWHLTKFSLNLLSLVFFNFSSQGKDGSRIFEEYLK